MFHSSKIPLCVLALALAAGCSSSGGGDGGNGTSGGTSGGGTSGGTTGGGQDSGPPGCKVDLDCAIFHTLCNVFDGGCVLPPHPCDPNRGTTHGGSQCNGVGLPNCTNPDDPSVNFCFCKVDHTSDAGGYCYPQLKPCATCTSDQDCGAAGSGVDYVGVCTTLDAPPGSGTSVCLRYEVGGDCNTPTGGGFVTGGTVNGGTVCECANMQCPCGPCTTDSDCTNPALGVCARGGGICEAPCLPGLAKCPIVAGVQQVCHVMDKYLDPTLPLEFYGGGRCGPPCTGDSDCQSPYYSVPNGVPLHCNPASTCRPPQGWCIADFECTNSPHPDASVAPFCDVWADGGAACNGQSCRLGTNTHDMTMLNPFTDCLATFACQLEDGGNPNSVPDASQQYGYGTCELLPCYDISPTFQYGCANNQLCCGAGDAGALNPNCQLGKCYCAPKPPWCVTCTDPDSPTSSQDPACQGLIGFINGPAYCTTTFGRMVTPHCGMECSPDEPWTCPSFAICTGQSFLDAVSCPAGTTAEKYSTTTSDYWACICPTGQCPAPPLVGGSNLIVNNCSKCPDPSLTGCLPDNATDGGFVCVCPADGGGTPTCEAIAGASNSTICLSASNPAICASGTPMIWNGHLPGVGGGYVLSNNCIIRDCTGSGDLDAGC